jgi:predicted membrane channel-forming protein YqfA (hemolysin III family)
MALFLPRRPPLPWGKVFQSMLYLHNQTGNILSHLICGIAMTVLMICTYVLVLAPQPGMFLLACA